MSVSQMTEKNDHRQAFSYGPNDQRRERAIKFSATLCLAGALAAVSACTKHPEEVLPVDVSPMTYKSMKCSELQELATQRGIEVKMLSDALTAKANRDDGLVAANQLGRGGIGPLMALGGTKEREAKLADAKGHFLAIAAAGRSKKCRLKFGLI